MNLEELRSVQEAERQRSDLQPLRESFYEEAGEYIADMKRRRDRTAAEAEDPFSSADVRRLSDEIDTAEEVVEAVYERRLGKLVERASLAASDMAVDEDGLSAEERALFQDLVERMRVSKRAVLDTLDGATTEGATTDEPASESSASSDDGVSAAGLMGEDTGESAGQAVDPGTAPANGHDGRNGTTPESTVSTESQRDEAPELRATPGAGSGTDGETGDGATERVTLRITRDVDEFVGVDDRQYDLAAEDVVVLPARNAGPLLEKGAAERLD
ncbi:hypothetical protein BRD13_07100 [Halobacteriales archaeon SW_5_70_135]|nr:MAG: hypothetical protein BRD13_07100 [Halobacteriales archaeon SW_5_70_135]